MKYRISICFFCFYFLFGATSFCLAAPLHVYTATKGVLMEDIARGFQAKYPDVDFRYTVEGAGRLMERLLHDKETGALQADVLWTTELSDFFALKSAGELLPYQSPEAVYLAASLPEAENFFVQVRYVLMVVARNKACSRTLSTGQVHWEDLVASASDWQMVIASPSSSGTGYMTFQLLLEAYGWEYIEAFLEHQGIVAHSAKAVTERLEESSTCLYGIIPDYLAQAAIDQGAELEILLPVETIVLPSAAGILASTRNPAAGERFIDYLLSEEAQKIIAKHKGMPARAGIPLSPVYKGKTVKELLATSIPVPIKSLVGAKSASLHKFYTLVQEMQKR